MKKEKKSHFNLWIYVVITICILSSSIAYSALNATLKVTGDVTISKAQDSTPYKLSKTALKEILNNQQFTEVYFNTTYPPVESWYTYDVSIGGDGSVKAAPFTFTDTGYSALYIVTFEGDSLNGEIPLIMPELENMFTNSTSLECVYFGEKVDFSNVSSMDFMFSHCEKLTTVSADGSYYDAPKLQTMSSMFEYCTKLTFVSFLSTLRNTCLEAVDFMFDHCTSLTTIDLRNITTTGSFSDYSYGMFYYCTSLKTIYLNKANFSNCDHGTPPAIAMVTSGVTIYVLNAANKTWWEEEIARCNNVTGTVIVA